jgi:ATP-dependent Clp protease ATP-binding subunit ClpB
VGQLGPIYALASAIRRKQNGWHDEDHPLVFMFCGSSGVGKTELAKSKEKRECNASLLIYIYIYCLALAQYLHGKQLDKGFIRIDMSEFQHKVRLYKRVECPSLTSR